MGFWALTDWTAAQRILLPLAIELLELEAEMQWYSRAAGSGPSWPAPCEKVESGNLARVQIGNVLELSLRRKGPAFVAIDLHLRPASRPASFFRFPLLPSPSL